MIGVSIVDRQKSFRVDRKDLAALARRVLREEGISTAEIGLAFVNDAEIAELNERFLGHEGPTDVLTFPLSEPLQPLLAEIVVSVETARRVARTRRGRVEDELRLYVIHGLLHLCGYDDRRPDDRRRMHWRQREHLAAWRAQ
jgi:probable rRNA maturation factor